MTQAPSMTSVLLDLSQVRKLKAGFVRYDEEDRIIYAKLERAERVLEGRQAELAAALKAADNE